jgi:hypothetical protein
LTLIVLALAALATLLLAALARLLVLLIRTLSAAALLAAFSTLILAGLVLVVRVCHVRTHLQLWDYSHHGPNMSRHQNVPYGMAGPSAIPHRPDQSRSASRQCCHGREIAAPIRPHPQRARPSAARARFADAMGLPMPRFIEPALATSPPKGEQWVHEIKDDCYRSRLMSARAKAASAKSVS